MQVSFAIVLTFVLAVNTKNVAYREPRFIRGTYTKTVTENKVVTSLVPSSCVYLDATLPPCRNVRYMKFPNFLSNNWQEQSDEKQVRSETLPKIQSTSMGWGEYLGFYAPTVTVTELKVQTALIADPRIVVTYAVKGCRPLRIPSELDRCPEETSSAVPIQEILPTSTIGALTQVSTTVNPHLVTPPSNARFVDLAAAKAYEAMRKINDVNQNLRQSDDVIESSSNQNEFEPVKPTETLPF